MTATQRVSIQPSLERVLLTRLATTAILAMLLQLVIVAARSYLDHDALLIAFVTREANALAQAVSRFSLMAQAV